MFNYLFILLMFLGSFSYAQNTINSSGGNAIRGGITFEWSIGEMTLVHTAAGNGIAVTQGVLQPLIIEEDTTIKVDEPKLSQNQLHLFPNPTENNLYLQPNLAPNSVLALRLYDISGRLLYDKKVFLLLGNEKQSINLSGYAAANYILSVTTEERNTKFYNSFKIIKK